MGRSAAEPHRCSGGNAQRQHPLIVAFVREEVKGGYVVVGMHVPAPSL